MFGGFVESWLSWFFYKMPDLSSHTFPLSADLHRARIQAIRREKGDSFRVTGNVITESEWLRNPTSRSAFPIDFSPPDITNVSNHLALEGETLL